MTPSPPPDFDPWDLDRLRLPDDLMGGLPPRRRPPRHRPGEAFLKGPIPYRWVATACNLDGAGPHVAIAIRFLCGRYRGENRWGLGAIAQVLQVSPKTAQRGLHAAEEAGLVTVCREPGCKLVVSVLELSELESGPARRPLYGPIPWALLLPALRLPGPALQVAMVCWLIAGWERSAEFELGLSEWGDLGLSRFAAGRGLRSLERVGLVSVRDGPGRKPLVNVQDATQRSYGGSDVTSRDEAGGSP